MPAVMDDPTGPTIHRVSGQQPPFPDPNSPGLPADIVPRQVTLRDRQTVATIVPFASRHEVPGPLLAYLCDQLNREIEGGDTYPMTDAFTVDGFADYWFQTFGAVMLLGGGNIDSADDVNDDDNKDRERERDWAKECLGSFSVKPNYPGRSSHVCNGSFITTDASRNRGVGRLMGEAYIDWAPRLGYTYSVFNLVYETNVASCRIWDALGFKRIGRVKACGNLRSHPDRLVDAIVYGRDLAPGAGAGDDGGGEELVSEERFDKIRFYLKHGKYPHGADRAEKSRLRSAATHYKLLEGDKLMLKDKEVISDPARQYDIARNVHALHHGGINKTTASIAERYHWSRIKETVCDVIRACVECKELGKTPNPGGCRKTTSATTSPPPTTMTTTTTTTSSGMPTSSSLPIALNSTDHQRQRQQAQQGHAAIMTAPSPPQDTSASSAYANPTEISVVTPSHAALESNHAQASNHLLHHPNSLLQDTSSSAAHESVYQPIDPQIITHHHHHQNHPSSQQDDMPFDHYHPHAEFQALLHATEDETSHDPDEAAAAAAAVDRDLEMLIEHDGDEDEMGGLDSGRRTEHLDGFI